MNKFFLIVAFAFTTASSPYTAFAQIEQVGRDVTFDVATWNIEWFGSPSNGPSDDDRQVQNVRDIMLGSGIELWAVQEIANAGRFQELLTDLGTDWTGELATISGSQRVGYVWDTRVVRKRSIGHILVSFDFAGRPPLKAEFEITLPDTTMIVTLINVHMKAFGDASSWARRVSASNRVKNHIDFSTLASASVIFLGDYNDELLQSTYANETSPYENFLNDPANYLVTTLPLEINNQFTWIGSSNGSNFDHITISSELLSSYIPGSANIMGGLNSLIGFTAQTSDHLPVFASFGSSVVLDVDEPDIPVAFRIDGLYPNPARRETNISLSIPGRSDVVVEIIDVLGRSRKQHLFSFSAGAHVLSVELDNLPSGTYFARVTGEHGSAAIPFLIMR